MTKVFGNEPRPQDEPFLPKFVEVLPEDLYCLDRNLVHVEVCDKEQLCAVSLEEQQPS